MNVSVMKIPPELFTSLALCDIDYEDGDVDHSPVDDFR